MTKVVLTKEALLNPLQMVTGVVERKQTKPILAHILLIFQEKVLTIIGTDTEVEIHALLKLSRAAPTALQFTLPGKKFFDICRALPDNSKIELNIDEQNKRVTAVCGKSRFAMATLPITEFSRAQTQVPLLQYSIAQDMLRKLITKTAFAIPQQDVRQYLNGLFFEIKDGVIRVLATDGHRLAMHSAVATTVDSSCAQVIIPRKSVNELQRLLVNATAEAVDVNLTFSDNTISVSAGNFKIISNLIGGKFLNYNKIIPQKGEIQITINCFELKNALLRVNILSNEIFRSVQFRFRNNTLSLATNNPEQETATEELAVNYQGEELDISFNISYFLDLLNTIETPEIIMYLKRGGGGVVIEETGDVSGCLYVLMPIRQ